MTAERLNTMLLVLLAFIVGFGFRQLVQPAEVHAQQSNATAFYIEPGTTVLRAPDGKRQETGRMVIDLRTGDIWGFPTKNNSLYPMELTSTEPPVSHPMYLGKFDFDMIAQRASGQ